MKGKGEVKRKVKRKVLRKFKDKGFTLVELMISVLLSGIVLITALPLIVVGQNADAGAERRESVELAGDAIYEFVADEVKFAGRMFLGNLDNKRPMGENWESITVSKKGGSESYARLLYGSARKLTEEAADPGSPLYDMSFQERTDLVFEAEAVGRNLLKVTVKLWDGEKMLYERESVLSLLNLTLDAAGQIEGYVGGPLTTAAGDGESALVLWYQSSKHTVNPFETGIKARKR